MSPHSAELSALMDTAARAFEAGDDSNAEPLLLQIVALNPRDLMNTLGVAHGEAQRLQDAVCCFKRALKDSQELTR